MNGPLICLLSQKHINVHVNKSNPHDSIIEGTVQSLTHVNFILSFSPTANKNKIREAHRKLMILNHPDRGETLCFIKWKSYKSLQDLNSSVSVICVSSAGGSPYLAAKINEAKDLLDGQMKK